MQAMLRLFLLLFIYIGCVQFSVAATTPLQGQPIVAAAQHELYLPALKGLNIGVVVNQTSHLDGQHLVDFLQAQGMNVKAIFAPEHGFRGDHDAGAHVKSAVDSKTGIKIVSIYGSNKKPATGELDELDVILFDIQDVGVRFYTYISSMHYMMEAAAQHNIKFIVLDRPNPNIAYVDGPVLDPKFRSFVGMHPIPILHGMTVGELALMIKGEGWISSADTLDLTVIPVANYTRNTPYQLPIKPSPNLPNAQSVRLYPSLCFFEATPISIGRGTDFPFQVIGFSPVPLGDFKFAPRAIKGAAMHPKFKGVEVLGLDLRQSDIKGLELGLFISAYRQLKANNLTFFEREGFMDKLAGTDTLRLAIEAGHSEERIKQSWQPALKRFNLQRAPYLLYR